MPAIEELLNGRTISAETLAGDIGRTRNGWNRNARFEGCLLITLGEEQALAIADEGEDVRKTRIVLDVGFPLTRSKKAPFMRSRRSSSGSPFTVRTDV